MARKRQKGYWFWAARGAWFHTDPGTGKRVRLADGPKSKETEAKAEQAYHRLMAGGGHQPDPDRITVGELADRWLESRRLQGNDPASIKSYAACLVPLKRDFGLAPADVFTEDDLIHWMGNDVPSWGEGMRSGAVKAYLCMFRWAASPKRRLIPSNPLSEMKAPPMPRREFVYPAGLHDQIVAEAIKMRSPTFADLWLALAGTGARPGEIAKIEARHCREEDGCVIADLTDHKNKKKTQRTRFIIFRGSLVDMVREKCKRWPVGPIFRTKNRKPWNRSKWSAALRAIRRRLGMGEEVSGKMCTYALRHTFITSGKRAGMDSLMLAQACGTSVAMIERHYGHLQVGDIARELAKIDR